MQIQTLQKTIERLLATYKVEVNWMLRQEPIEDWAPLEPISRNQLLMLGVPLLFFPSPKENKEKPKMWWCTTERLWKCQQEHLQGKGTTKQWAYSELMSQLEKR